MSEQPLSRPGQNQDRNALASISMDVLLSQRTMNTVVVFSSNEGFVSVSDEALRKQGFSVLPTDSQTRLADYCSKGYLNYLLDCDLPNLHIARTIVTTARACAPRGFIVAYCPRCEWAGQLKDTGVNVVIESGRDISVQIMHASTGFLKNINSIIGVYLESTKLRIKETTIRSRFEKATAKVAHLSLEQMLQTDANVRAFLTNSWPASRHGQYVAIAGGKIIAFGNNSWELAERLRNLAASGNILIQRIECEDDSFGQDAT